MSNVSTSVKNWSTTAASNQPDGPDSATIAADLRAIQAGVRNIYSATTLASATTTDLGSVDDHTIAISGTTTITAFGTVSAGIRKILKFDGVLTLTHNGTSLILPAAANITTAANDTAEFESLGSGNWRCNWYKSNTVAPIKALSGLTMSSGTLTNDVLGKHTIWIPAAAMITRTTNGAASGTVETSTNKIMLRTFDFDTTTAEYVQFSIQMPKSWNEGTVTFRAVWSHAATTTNFGVAWSLQGVALSDDDAADTAFGTKQTVTDTGGTTDDIYITSESSAITIAGTPAAQDWVVFQVERTVGDAGNTLGIDARLHGIQLYYTTDAGNDA